RPLPARPSPETVAAAPPESAEPASATPVAATDAGTPTASTTDAGPTADREAELAWARSRWPKQLAPIETHSHTADLAAWVSGSTPLDIWFTGEKLKCKRGTLARGDKTDDLELKVFTFEGTVKGVRTRKYTDGTAGHLLWFGAGGGQEFQQ